MKQKSLQILSNTYQIFRFCHFPKLTGKIPKTSGSNFNIEKVFLLPDTQIQIYNETNEIISEIHELIRNVTVRWILVLQIRK